MQHLLRTEPTKTPPQLKGLWLIKNPFDLPPLFSLTRNTGHTGTGQSGYVMLGVAFPPILQGEVLQAESTEMEKGEMCCSPTQEYASHLTWVPGEERQRGNLLVLAVETLDNQSLGSLDVNPNIQAGGFRAEPAFPTEKRHATLCHPKA